MEPMIDAAIVRDDEAGSIEFWEKFPEFATLVLDIASSWPASPW